MYKISTYSHSQHCMCSIKRKTNLTTNMARNHSVNREGRGTYHNNNEVCTVPIVLSYMQRTTVYAVAV